MSEAMTETGSLAATQHIHVEVALVPPRLNALWIAADRSQVPEGRSSKTARIWEAMLNQPDWVAVVDQLTGVCWTMTPAEALLLLWLLAAGMLDD